ncbi:MAG: hypothetical protein II131_01610 [Neisseriaceae bacterium]|nr:hypothetical protein [Neisseriaceae bacterium]
MRSTARNDGFYFGFAETSFSGCLKDLIYLNNKGIATLCVSLAMTV